MKDDYLTLAEAAEYIGVSRAKLSRMVGEGAISHTSSPLDKRLKLFRRADLDPFRSAPKPAERRAS
jgi:excisionase family DNA binding protein